jgi:hypothetical protein
MGNSGGSINLIENIVDLEYWKNETRFGTIKYPLSPNGNRQD